MNEYNPSCAERELFSSFHLGGHEVALSVEIVREVVHGPSKYIAVPLAPPFLLGLFSLRGAILPVVDAATLLNLPRSTDGVGKVAILQYGQVCIGLRFDDTGEIFRGDSKNKSVFRSQSSGTGLAVEGAYSLEGGKRVIQILSAYSLLDLDGIPLAGELSGETEERMQYLKLRGNRKQCISFSLGQLNLAINIDGIQEIVGFKGVDDSTFSSDVCIGGIMLRGSMIPLMDFSLLLGYRPSTLENVDKNVIIISSGAVPVGLLVDSVDSIVSYYEAELASFPLFEMKKRDMFLGCITEESENHILLLNPDEILSTEEKSVLEDCFLSTEIVADVKIAKEETAKKTYLSFVLNGFYAIEIEKVQEVIELSDESQIFPMAQLSESFCGVLNLRGDMIAIVDTRKMYGLSNDNLECSQKALIFEKGTDKFGLLVDAVDSIVNISSHASIALPELMLKKLPISLQNDITEIVQVDSGEERKKPSFC